MPPPTPTNTRKRQLAKKKVKKAPKRVYSPTSRSDAAQRTGARPKKVNRVGPPTPHRAGVGKTAGPPTPKRAGVGKKAGPPTPVRPRIRETGGGKIGKKNKGSVGGGVVNFAAGTLPLPKPIKAALIKDPNKTLKTGGKILENSAREAIQLPSSLVPTAAYLTKPISKSKRIKIPAFPDIPKGGYGESAKRVGEGVISLPKEYIKAGKEKGLEGIGETFVKHPLSTALTVAPIPRGPGMIVGGVARRAGKMPKIPDRVLPGTAMKQQVKPSKSYFKAKRQAKKGQEEIIEDPPKGLRKAVQATTGGRVGANSSVIEKRVDAQVALMENLSRREQASTYKKTYKSRKKVVGKKEAVREAANLASEAQKKVRKEQSRFIAEGMGLLTKDKVKTTHPRPISPKQTALRNQIVNLSEAVGQAEKALKTEKDHLAEGQKLRRELLADGKSVAPIQNRLIDSAQRVENRAGELKQLRLAHKKADEQHAREVLRKGPLAVQVVEPGGKLKTFKTQGEAELAASQYKGPVEMDAFKTKGEWTVIPASAKKRLEQHEANTETGWFGAGIKSYNTVWRKNVLALHPSWYAGNIIEAAARSLVGGVGPTAYRRGYKYKSAHRGMDREGAKVAEGHTTSGGHLKMQARLPEETKADIQGHGFLANVARGAQAVRDNPHGPKQAADYYNMFTDFTMGTLSGKAESFFQTGMLGKELARSPLAAGHVNKTSKAAIDDYVKGMKETHNQIALGEAVDRMYGQYGKWSPGMRKAIANYTPFIAWTMNSLNFLYRVLPVDHPVLTAAVASTQPYVEEWLKDEGLSPFVKGALPSFLQGSVPTKGGKHARYPTRYLPTSVAAGFPESAVGSLLPQLEPAYNMAVHGINWKGQKVNNPDGTPLDPLQLSIASALTLLEGGIPGAQQIAGPADRYAVQGARTPKKVFKPKKGKEIANSFLNPFQQVDSAKKGSKKASKPKNDLDSLIGGGGTKKVKKKKANTLDSLINP